MPEQPRAACTIAIPRPSPRTRPAAPTRSNCTNSSKAVTCCSGVLEIDAVADAPATVLVVPQAELQAWLDRPAHWQHVARLACGKLRLLFGVLEDIQLLSLEQNRAA